MDDLKVVFYIVVAIIWIVYNNYKKIRDAASKRDFSKPHGDVIQENWPAPPQKPVRRESPVTRREAPVVKKEVVQKQSTREIRKVLEREPLPQRKPIRRATPVTSRKTTEEPSFYTLEGGAITPSRVVQFEEQAYISEAPNPLLTAIRNMDFRQGIVLAEVLKRPYN